MVDADVVHGRAPLGWPRQLLPQVCLTLLLPCRPPHGPVQPPGSVHVGPAEQQSFDTLKAALTSAPELRVWDPVLPTRLLTDASELAVLAIPEQPDDASLFHPVALKSQMLTQLERSYPPYLLELLAAEYQYRVVHIPGRINPADFLTRKRFVAAGPATESPRFLYADFAAAVRQALPSDTVASV